MASAETLYTLERGYKVNYDKVLTADNHQWISYIGAVVHVVMWILRP
ncbi:MAG: SH3 domain-containing protein [Streptococcus sp.]